MEVYYCIFPVPVEHLSDTFHSGTVKGNIIKIKSIYTHFFAKPVYTFHIIVMPARHAGIDNGSIFIFRYKPGCNIVINKVFLQPVKAFACTRTDNLMAEAS